MAVGRGSSARRVCAGLEFARWGWAFREQTALDLGILLACLPGRRSRHGARTLNHGAAGPPAAATPDGDPWVDNGGMANTEVPESVDLRIETSHPGTDHLSIHVTARVAEEIATAFEDAGGLVTRDTVELSVSDVLQSVMEVAGPIAASGAAVAGVLKQWWHRNDGKKVTVTFNGESISLEGMSTEQMAQIIDAAHSRWDERWRQQFPDRFPDGKVSRAAEGAGGQVPNVTVAQVSSRSEADLIVGLLGSGGVRSVVSADDAGGQEPQLQLDGVRVLVDPSDAAVARQILADVQAVGGADDDDTPDK
jgi:hypothetical protein